MRFNENQATIISETVDENGRYVYVVDIAGTQVTVDFGKQTNERIVKHRACIENERAERKARIAKTGTIDDTGNVIIRVKPKNEQAVKDFIKTLDESDN